MFSDPSPGWIVVFLVGMLHFASDGETVPVVPALIATGMMFGLWRLSLWAVDSLRR